MAKDKAGQHKWNVEDQPAAETPVAEAKSGAVEGRARHTPFYPYPIDVPAEVLTMCIDVLRGVMPDKKEAVHAVMHILSYGLGKWDPEGAKPEFGTFKGFATATLTPHQLADLLASAAGRKSDATVTDAFNGIPWDVVIPILLAFLKRLVAA